MRDARHDYTELDRLLKIQSETPPALAPCPNLTLRQSSFPATLDIDSEEAAMIAHRLRYSILAVAGLLLTAGNASAHHVMGGRMPSTFAEGLLSGIGHPIIGADHLAFLVGLGVAVGIGGLSLVTPLMFLIAMACGVAVHVAAVNIPGAELIVALSALAAGALLATGRSIHAGWWMALFVVAGFFHGYAYGESIYGAESTPLAAYLAGLVAVQAVLTIGVAFITRALWQSKLAPRLAGAAIGGVGFAALVAHIIPAP
jgi:urease accessory protein